MGEIAQQFNGFNSSTFNGNTLTLQYAMKRLMILAGLVFFLTSCSEKKTAVFTTENGAIDGYDAVAFFTDSAAVKGDKTLSTDWNGATWCFSSQEHLDAFKASPEKYAPQYGGYCAYGTADGHLSPTETDTWTVRDGKLYFNYNQKVKNRWMQDQDRYIIEADKNWPGLSQ